MLRKLVVAGIIIVTPFVGVGAAHADTSHTGCAAYGAFVAGDAHNLGTLVPGIAQTGQLGTLVGILQTASCGG